MMRKIYLEGEIAERFGTEFDVHATSIKEAISCLETNLQGFREYLVECCERGVGFIFSVENDYLQKDEELLLQYPKGSFTMSALPAGSKSGIAKIFAAIAIIVVVAATGGFGAGGWAMAAGGGLSTAGSIVVGVALSLALTGIAQMMAPDPSVDGGSESDESNIFQGSGQNINEGDPVPVVYGRLRIPGRPISLEIKNDFNQFLDYADPIDNAVIPNDPGDNGGGENDQSQGAPDTDPGNTQRVLP